VFHFHGLKHNRTQLVPISRRDEDFTLVHACSAWVCWLVMTFHVQAQIGDDTFGICGFWNFRKADRLEELYIFLPLG
jgi:hypothetical protein